MEELSKDFIQYVYANFTDADIWATLTYETDRLPNSDETAQKEMIKFISRLRYYGKKHNLPLFKYAYVTHFKNRAHHHIITNFPDRNVLEKLWRNGLVRTRHVDLLDKYKNNYDIDIKQYCTRHACMDCEYFEHAHLVRINRDCPLLPLKEEALREGYEELRQSASAEINKPEEK